MRTVRIQLHPGASPWREALRGGGRSGCQFVGLFAVTRGKSKLWPLQKSPVETESLSAVLVYWRISSVFWPAQSRMDPSSHVPFVDRLAQRSAQMQVSVIQLSSSYTRPPRNQFLLQSSNGWAACSGFCRTRRTIERDQMLRGFGESRGEKTVVPRRRFQRFQRLSRAAFGSGMLMFRGLMSENCLDGTLRLIRGSHPLGSRLEQIEGRCNKTHKRGDGIGSGDPNTEAFQRSENELE